MDPLAGHVFETAAQEVSLTVPGGIGLVIGTFLRPHYQYSGLIMRYIQINFVPIVNRTGTLDINSVSNNECILQFNGRNSLRHKILSTEYFIA